VNTGVKIITPEHIFQLPLESNIVYPASILLDSKGNLFIGDYMDRKVYMIAGMIPEYRPHRTYFADMKRFLSESRNIGSSIDITIRGVSFNIHKEMCNVRATTLLQFYQ